MDETTIAKASAAQPQGTPQPAEAAPEHVDEPAAEAEAPPGIQLTPEQTKVLQDYEAQQKKQIEGLDEAATFCDPLLESLILIARLEHQPFSESSLTAGLPLVEEQLTPRLFIRAAERAGLSAKVVMRSFEDISPLVLPAVLILKGNDACVLNDINHETGTVQLLDPHSDGETITTIEELKQNYCGYAIFCKPLHRYDERTQDLAIRHEGHWFWGVLKRSWRIYRDVLLASLFINLFAVVSPLFTMNVYDRVVPNGAIETLWVLALGVMVVYLFDFALKMLRAYFLEVAGKKADIILSSMIFEKVLGARLEERPKSVGSFSSQLRDFESVRTFFTSSSVTAFVDLPFMIIFLIVIGYVGGYLVLVPIACIPIILGFALSMIKPMRASVEASMQSSAQKNATLIESLNSIETIKSLGAEGRVQRVWEKSVGNSSFWGQKSKMLSTTATTWAGMVLQLNSVGLILVGVYLIVEKEITMGALIASVMLSGRALAPLSQVTSLLITLEQTLTSLKSLDGIVKKSQEREEETKFIKRPNFSGNIQFKQVGFTYPDEDNKSIEELSFSIRAGERVGIIGRMGSGKSTIHRLMMGLYRATEGSVLVDGIDIKQLDPADLRNGIAYVPQDVSLFYGSVKENIAYGTPHASDAKILHAAEIAGVSAFVNRHPQGFQRPVGEQGAFLSGGQRQSIAIARAMIKDAGVYLFDEPTTGMDNASEAAFKKKLWKEMQGKTLVLVTHKTSLLDLVDRLIVMENGKLIADGPKASVLDALKKGQIRVEQ